MKPATDAEIAGLLDDFRNLERVKDITALVVRDAILQKFAEQRARIEANAKVIACITSALDLSIEDCQKEAGTTCEECVAPSWCFFLNAKKRAVLAERGK